MWKTDWFLQFLMSDVFLRSALHLLELEEYEEAAFFAEKSAEIEKGVESHFDAHLGFCVAAECYAKALCFSLFCLFVCVLFFNFVYIRVEILMVGTKKEKKKKKWI